MSLIDWRELYASNRAAIERGRGAAGRQAGSPGAGAGPGAAGAVRARTGAGAAPSPTRVAHRTPRAPGRPAIVVGGRRALVHPPAGADPAIPVPLVCLLHGCAQDAAAFAAATGMDAAADRHGFLAVYPEQKRGENQQRCWNWFLPEHQARGAGEPASIVGVVRTLVGTTSEWTVDPRRVFVAGLSAGGAMAAILAATYPDVFAAVAVHSGLAYRAATSTGAAFAAMARGAEGSPADPGAAVHAAMGPRARPVPSMVIHGSADRTVAPVNADQVLAQGMAANRLAAPEVGDLDPARPSEIEHGQVDGGLPYARAQWRTRHGALLHERLTVEGLGHAWSGGAPGGSFTDPRGPDATEAIWRFFAEAARD